MEEGEQRCEKEVEESGKENNGADGARARARGTAREASLLSERVKECEAPARHLS